MVMAATIGVAALSAAHAEDASTVSGGGAEPAMESCNPLLDDADDLEREELKTVTSIKIDAADSGTPAPRQRRGSSPVRHPGL